MKMNKFTLLAAAAASAFGAGAHAQELFPTAQLNGNGASLPANVHRQALDCYGLKAPIAFSAGDVITLGDFDFDTPALDSLANRFNCAGNSIEPPIAAGPAGSAQFGNPRIVQPQITALYLSTGSSAGVRAWAQHIRPEAAAGNSSVVVPTGFASYGDAAVQYALSESALSFNNLNGTSSTAGNSAAGYNTFVLPATVANDGTTPVPAGTAVSRYGAAIQIPIYIAPVTVMYAPVYAKARNLGGLINNYRFTIGAARADGSGGLRLTRGEYCGIFNGVITNWNQLPTADVNRDINDPEAFDVPMQIVGRSEGSGTTTLFTRALAAQCDGAIVNTNVGGDGAPVASRTPVTITNRYANATDLLPAALLNGAFFVKSTTTSPPSITGNPTPGFFLTANGSDGVSEATNFHVDPAAGTNPSLRTENGKIGYVGPDFTLPGILFTGQNDFGLNTASLAQNGSTTVFEAPTPANATQAFSTVDPPQSTGTSGAYCRTGGTAACNTTVVAASGIGNRANPLDWVFPANRFLVDTATGVTDTTRPNPIASPVAGYPIVGTSNVLLYTCYFTPALRIATNGLWATFQGATTKDYNNQSFPAALFTDATRGVLARNGLAAMPLGWRNAIRETFFKSSVQTSASVTLGSQNLWIQSRIPTVASTASTTSNSLANATANPTCAGLIGA